MEHPTQVARLAHISNDRKCEPDGEIVSSHIILQIIPY